MLTSIDDWPSVYRALKQRAEAMRGAVELHVGTADHVRWPRTTGADVVAISAVIDRHVRRLRATYGKHTLIFRWRACLQDIARFALSAPGTQYAKNREFWDCLAIAVAYLASVDAPLPDPTALTTLIENLGHILALRNIGPEGGGPFNFNNAKTFGELYIQQSKQLRALRGFDEMEPGPGMFGASRPIPRSTNADVIMLADYWTTQLALVKDVMGRENIEKLWSATVQEVNAFARTAGANEVYAKNNGFWRALLDVATHVSVADEAPSKWDLAKDSIKDSIKQLPDRIGAGAEKVADVASDIARGAGKAVNEAGRGLFSGIGGPLLIGGGLLGLFLLSRSRNTDKAGKE
jgi:hypothetical protein